MNVDVDLDRLQAENAALNATIGVLTTPTVGLRALREHHIEQAAHFRTMRAEALKNGWHHTALMHTKSVELHERFVRELNVFFPPTA